MPTCRDSRGFEGTGRYVRRDPWPTHELGRTLLRKTVEDNPRQWAPDLEDLYSGYVMGQDGVFRPHDAEPHALVEPSSEPNHARDTRTSPLTMAQTYEEGFAIIKNTTYVGTTAELSGDAELLRNLL